MVHVGTGTGCYTAIMGRLVGDSGRVRGIEYETDLADAARRNLASHANVTIARGDGFTMPFEPTDVIFVNAGAPRPATTWLDALNPGGRLVLPLCVLTSDDGKPLTRGAVFLIERDAEGFAATLKAPTMIYPCLGASDEAAQAALSRAFKSERAQEARRLHRTADVPDRSVWLRGPGWCCAYA